MSKITVFGRLNDYKVQIESMNDDKAQIYTMHRVLSNTYDLQVYDKFLMIGSIDIDEFDCIWEVQDFEVIKVIKGQLEITKSRFEDMKVVDEKPFRKYMAMYQGKNYRNYQGVNNKYVYKLYSYGFDSQSFGFTLVKPGVFELEVPPEKIEHEFIEDIWCSYLGHVFVPKIINQNMWIITPYSDKHYVGSELKELGFYKEKERYFKDVDTKKLDSIWIVRKGVGKSKGLNLDFDLIQGVIPRLFLDNLGKYYK